MSAEKRHLADALAVIERHYQGCWHCRSMTQPCDRAERLWDEAVRLHGVVVRACVRWHSGRPGGVEKIVPLLKRLQRIVRAVTP